MTEVDVNRLDERIDRLFYRDRADYRHALTSLSRSLVITPDLSQTLRILDDQLNQAINPERFVIYLYNDERGEYLPHATREDSAPPYLAGDPLVSLIRDSETPLWLAPGLPLPAILQTVAAFYERLRGYVFVPLRYESRLIGFILLGPRRSGELYTSDDLDFLAAVAGQSTLALENARLFTNLRRTLDQTLEMKNLMDDIFASMATGVMQRLFGAGGLGASPDRGQRVLSAGGTLCPRATGSRTSTDLGPGAGEL